MRTLAIFTFLVALGSAAQPVSHVLPDRLTHPVGVVFTDNGRGWIATVHGPLYRLDPGGTLVEFGNIPGAFGFILGPDGAPWGHVGSSVFRIDPETSAIQTFDLGNQVHGIAAEPGGLLWIITGGDRLIRMNASGGIVSNVSIDLDFPASLLGNTRNGDIAGGAFWLPFGEAVVRLTASGAHQTFPLPHHAAKVVSAGGFLWAGVDSDHVLKLSLGGAVLLDVALPQDVAGITVDAEGNLWTLAYFSSALRRVTPEGVVTAHGTLPRPATVCSYFGPDQRPTPMTFTPDGRLAVVQLAVLDQIGVDPCLTDERGVDTLYLIDAAAHGGDIPALGASALLALAVILAGLGVLQLFRT